MGMRLGGLLGWRADPLVHQLALRIDALKLQVRHTELCHTQLAFSRSPVPEGTDKNIPSSKFVLHLNDLLNLKYLMSCNMGSLPKATE